MDEHTQVLSTFQIEDCGKFILNKQLKKVVLELKNDDLKYSVEIIDHIKDQVKSCSQSTSKSESLLEIYVARSNTCSPDLMVTQHVTGVDSIIHFGNLCLSQPEVVESQLKLPILCVFTRKIVYKKVFDDNFRQLKSYLEDLTSDSKPNSTCILYDTSLIDYVKSLTDEKALSGRVDVAKLISPNINWETTPHHNSLFVKQLDGKIIRSYGHFGLLKAIENYRCIVYLGTCPQLGLILSGPSKFIKIDCYEQFEVTEIGVQKLLRRRLATIERIKDYEEMKIGVIVTNPLPNVRAVMERLEISAKQRKHSLYFISMIQTIDECKIGNFDLCDAFIVINSCHCSTILESLSFNRPIITEKEFHLACGMETTYGGVLWEGFSSSSASNLLTGQDLINKRRVSDVSIALNQTRNELLERCNQASANRWFGLEYNTTAEGEESLDIEEGLKGIASSYSSEPLKPSENRY